MFIWAINYKFVIYQNMNTAVHCHKTNTTEDNFVCS